MIKISLNFPDSLLPAYFSASTPPRNLQFNFRDLNVNHKIHENLELYSICFSPLHVQQTVIDCSSRTSTLLYACATMAHAIYTGQIHTSEPLSAGHPWHQQGVT